MAACTPDQQRIIETATVRLPRRGGQGVLVPGNLIVTAAHVIGWTSEGAMAYGDAFPEVIEAGGRTLTVDVLAIEPCADIAALGALDGQGPFHEEAEAFEAWCEDTTPVQLYAEDLPLGDEPPPRGLPRRVWREHAPSRLVSAWILTHDKGWIAARVKQLGRAARCLVVEADTLIEGGTSGGPVIAEDGRLLGVISTSGETWSPDTPADRRPASFSIPRPHIAAPVWAVAQMTGGMRAKRRS
jgi:hypothetical protein